MIGRTVAVAAVLCAALLTGCDPDTVQFSFDPTEGSIYQYRYEVSSSTTTILSESEPVETDRSSVIHADHTVLASDDEGIRVEVVLQRDQEAARSYVVRFDRGAQLSGIELVDGVALGSLGQGGLSEILSGAVGAPPPQPLRPGESWAVDTEVFLPGAVVPVRITGHGRLLELKRISDTEVATVETELGLPVEGLTDDGQTSFAGQQETSTTVSYDLVDGSVVEASSRTVGEVSLVIQPPIGLVGPPVEGSLRYVVETTTERLDARLSS